MNICRVCEKTVIAKGLCPTHYKRLQRHGNENILKTNRGNGFLDKDGYRRLSRNGKPLFEHRLVMESILGRPLLRTETVHHKNGDRADNRPENLELWNSAQPAGQRAIDKYHWALEIIRQYEAEVDLLEPLPSRTEQRMLVLGDGTVVYLQAKE